MSKVSVTVIGKSLKTPFSEINDPRINRKKEHKLIDILVIAVSATLSGADGFVAIEDWGKSNTDWLTSFLDLQSGIPSHDTFGRVFSLINPSEFQKAFRDWVKLIKKDIPEKEIIAIDGKYLRGSLEKAGKRSSAVIMVNAWATESGLSIAQLTSRLKKNEAEKQVMEKIIDCINVKGNIITIDAGGATTKIFNKIVDANGDAVIGLKNNQKMLFKVAKNIFDYDKNKDLITEASTENKGHGRQEKRVYQLIPFNKCITDGLPTLLKNIKKKWVNLKGIGRVTSERIINLTGEITTNTRYFIVSFGDSVDEFARAVRKHWHVENKLHYVLDVTFREDSMRARTGYAAENMAALRQMTLNLLKVVDSKKSIKRKRMICAWDIKYLMRILFSIDF